MSKINNYEEAYAEVIEILNYIPINEYKKIPKKYIIFMEENCSENNTFVYNIALPFNKQNISDTAKNILGMIFRLFIIDQTKKEALSIKEKESKKQIKNNIDYSPDNLFNTKHDSTKMIKEKPIQEVALIEFKESILKKILKKILNIFKR